MKGGVMMEIRWMLRSHLPRVLEIERDSFDRPWTRADFVDCLAQKNVIGLVLTWDSVVTGFVIYEIHKSSLKILNLAVCRVYRRKWIASALVEKLIRKMRQSQRRQLVAEVRETNLPCQLLLKKLGFKAVAVLTGHYEDSTEDCYVMQFLNEPDPESMTHPKNRISGFME